MRAVSTEGITTNIKEMCIEANHYLSSDMACVFEQAVEGEQSPLGRQVPGQLGESLAVTRKDMIPVCQDTEMAVVFMRVGQKVHIKGGSLSKAIHEGVHQGYREDYLRKSIVHDPIDRVNTSDNTSAVIHYEIVEGDQIDITVAPKGFGSESMNRVFILKPADRLEGVKEAILTAVEDAGPSACPLMIVGVGIGRTFEKCAVTTKHALTRNPEEKPSIPYIWELEEKMLEEVNRLGIRPGGLGGTVTAFAANIEVYPTHIADLPVAVSICCHVSRHIHRVLYRQNLEIEYGKKEWLWTDI